MVRISLLFQLDATGLMTQVPIGMPASLALLPGLPWPAKHPGGAGLWCRFRVTARLLQEGAVGCVTCAPIYSSVPLVRSA